LRCLSGKPAGRSHGPRALITVGVLVLLMAMGLRGAPPTASRLQGTVSAVGPDGQPFHIPGAELKFIGAPVGTALRSAFSESGGTYQFADVPPGSYTLEVSFPGFKKVAKTVAIPAGAMVVENIGKNFWETHFDH